MIKMFISLLFATVSLSATYYNETIRQTIQIHQVTWGACMIICEDIKFCTGADHNRTTSMCTLDIDTSHSSYQNLYQKCFHIPSNNWRISYQHDRWVNNGLLLFRRD